MTQVNFINPRDFYPAVIIFRYLTREVLLTSLALSVALLLIIMSGKFVHYLAMAATGELAGDLVFAVIFYRMPTVLELVIPLGLFLGILLSYGRLYVDSEMIVLSACGVSKTRLAVFTMGPVLVVGVLVASLSLFFTPWGWAKFNAIWDDPDNFSGLGTIVAGRFQKMDSNSTVTYAEKVNKERTGMSNVFVAGHRSGDAEPGLIVMVAESGKVFTEIKNQNRYIELQNGYRYEGNPGQLDFKVTRFERYGQLIRDHNEQVSAEEAEAKSTYTLFGSQQLSDVAALQWRISLPLMIPIIALMALALSETNHRHGRFVKMLPAIVLYIIYLVLLTASRSAVESGRLPPAIGLWAVHLVFLIVALVLLYGKDTLRQWQISKRSVQHVSDKKVSQS